MGPPRVWTARWTIESPSRCARPGATTSGAENDLITPEAPHSESRPPGSRACAKLPWVDSATYDIALLLHLLGALAFVAGIVLAGSAFEAARRRRRPNEIALLLGLTRIGVLLVAIGTVLIGAFGLWLVHLGHWGYGSGWVDASIGMYIVALALGGRGGQRPKQARQLAARLAERSEPVSDELRALLDDRASLAENYGSLALILVIVAFMVFKP
jgi:uncharacterized membrane protein